MCGLIHQDGGNRAEGCERAPLGGRFNVWTKEDCYGRISFLFKLSTGHSKVKGCSGAASHRAGAPERRQDTDCSTCDAHKDTLQLAVQPHRRATPRVLCECRRRRLKG
eukprot:6203926-Pleurochrysis_carterae.AAC.2